MKSVKQRLVEKLWKEFKFVVSPDDLIRYSGRKEQGQVSWSTLNRYPMIMSELAMHQCVALPIKLRPHTDEIIIDIDVNKLIRKE